MKRVGISNLLANALWTGWRRWAIWSVCLGVISVLAILQVVTEAEFAFASLELLPVLVISWVGGKKNGLIIASLAVTIWAISDVASEREHGAQWIMWANAVTRLMTYSVVALLSAQLRQQFCKEHQQATRDSLTGLLNRRAFLDAGDSEVERLKRYGHPLAVIFLDLDNFKQINDTFGHAAGDTALQATAEALLGTLRSSDTVARLGGDEFAVLLPETGFDAAVEAGRKIHMAVNKALEAFPAVKGSLGVAWFEDADCLFSVMLRAADELMYEVKQSGKNEMRSRRFSAMGLPDIKQQSGFN